MLFFRSKLLLRLLIGMGWFVGLVIAYLSSSKEPFYIVPGNPSIVNAWLFTDTLDGGHTKAGMLTPPNHPYLGFRYMLKEGYQYPYAGINFLFRKDSLPDLSRYDYVQLSIRAHQGSRLPIVIGIGDDSTNKPSGNRFLEYILPVGPEWRTVRISLEQFRSPEWWLKLNGKKEADLTTPDFSRLRFLNVQTCQILGTGKEDIVEVQSISLHQDMLGFYWFASLFSVLFGVLFGITFVKKKTVQNVVFSYTKTEAFNRSQKEEETIFSFITSNYHLPNLSIDDIQLATGIAEAKISTLIKNKSGLTFKQFLNKLRLAESKRLLSETDLQISEIAYKVGYSNVSHFNRTFKDAEACTPNDYRKQLQQSKQ